MKKRFILVLSMLLMSLTIAGFGTASEASAKAASEKSSIAQMQSRFTILLEDGTLWLRSAAGTWRVPTQFVDIKGDANSGWGLTASGKVLQWSGSGTLTEVKYMTDVAQISEGGFWLKKDGTVWEYDEQLTKYEDIINLDYSDSGTLLAVSKQNDLYGQETFPYLVKELGKTGEVQSLASIYYSAVVVQQDGQAYSYNFYDKVNKQLLGQDMVQVSTFDNQFLLTKKDGTLWITRGHSGQFSLEPLNDIDKVKRTVGSNEKGTFYAQLMDGTWIHYTNGKSMEMNAPSLKAVKLLVSKSQAKAGDHFTIEVEEEYTNGYKAKRVPTQEELKIDQPQLIERMANNQFKIKAVGEAIITVTVDGISEQAKIYASADKQLQFASNIKGLVYLPVKPVFETIGGKVAYDAKTKSFTIQLGEQTIAMKKDSKIATVNGKQITMGGVVQERGGQMIFSADLLKNMLGAKITWDDKLKTATVNLGSAKLVVISQETEKAIKKQQVGNLSKYVGKTYWVNDFQNWERFLKITVTDIIPKTDPYGDVLYIIQFKNAKGATLKTSQMGASSVEAHLTAGDTLLNYNPYTRYNWSNKTWDLIKKRKVALGMTKEQVLMSWGSPDHKSSIKSNGIVVESWGYGTYSLSIITFTNGKVSNLYQ